MRRYSIAAATGLISCALGCSAAYVSQPSPEPGVDRAANEVTRLFDIITDDTNSDKVRGQAMARLGREPKEMILPKLYSLFDKKWQVRVDAERMILKLITTKDVAEFMDHLPQDAKTKIGMMEPFSTGAVIMAMEPQGGPTPRTVLNGVLESKNLGAKLTAAGSFYLARKSEAAILRVLDGDQTLVPKCVPEDRCGWTCDIPTAPGSKETETKTIATVGEFVKWCIEPSLVDR